ncbi:2'-5' RNA ligase family protein [Luteibacter aegosomatissinici]|uniref:2'-5' RNA ligase family protein n=1 Tax=Luteibacter aegosomatissinici TaxID=2911539 RepID=UPI001FFB77A4|nr:2'-5' RNA ligase family protein [Luteibacter aegosomatissinici]UPG93064.1 2'-5' RNA ligase family protein [Luteibacter aegosomatissinici]
MSRTLVALLVPDAEPLVGDLRARLDPASKLGLGAHFTLLYPFHDTVEITPAHLASLREVGRRHAALAFSLERVGAFPSTVWLAPDPDEAIIQLANELEATFSGRPKVGREFNAFVPHLSVARNLRRAADRDAVVRTLEDRLAGGGVLCRCGELHLMARLETGWRSVEMVSLAG